MAYADEVTADSPQGYWKLDETSGTQATDATGNAHHGTYSGTPDLNQAGLITSRTAVKFNSASSQTVRIANNNLSTNGSMEFWFKWPAGVPTQVLVRDDTTTSGAGWILGFDVSGTFAIRIAGATFNTSLATSVVRDGSPHHFVMTKTGANIKVYIDTNEVLSATTALNTTSVTAWNFAKNGTSAVYTDVTLDEIAIYPAALSAARVLAHFNAGAAPPAAPTNTVAPAITTDGTPATTETISVSNGTWTSNPQSFTFQWKREGVNIAGATSNTYTLQAADEGRSIKCTVTATNAGGSAAADSNAIVPAVSSPLADTDVVLRLSGGVSNSDPTQSYGGAESSLVAGSDLFDPVSYPASIAGQADYRLIYVHNTHPVYGAGCKAYIAVQEADGQEIAVGVPTETAGNPVAQTSSKLTAPAGVTFSTPSDGASGIDLGTIAHNSFRGLWVKRTVDPLTPGSSSNPATVAIEVSQQ